MADFAAPLTMQSVYGSKVNVGGAGLEASCRLALVDEPNPGGANKYQLQYGMRTSGGWDTRTTMTASVEGKSQSVYSPSSDMDANYSSLMFDKGSLSDGDTVPFSMTLSWTGGSGTKYSAKVSGTFEIRGFDAVLSSLSVNGGDMDMSGEVNRVFVGGQDDGVTFDAVIEMPYPNIFAMIVMEYSFYGADGDYGLRSPDEGGTRDGSRIVSCSVEKSPASLIQYLAEDGVTGIDSWGDYLAYNRQFVGNPDASAFLDGLAYDTPGVLYAGAHARVYFTNGGKTYEFLSDAVPIEIVFGQRVKIADESGAMKTALVQTYNADGLPVPTKGSAYDDAGNVKAFAQPQ